MSDTELTRPIIGIENRAPQEVFDIMADRFRSAIASRQPVVTEEMVEGFAAVLAQSYAVFADLRRDDNPLAPRKANDHARTVAKRALEAALTKPEDSQ